jgi:hypothetical protein
VMNRSSNLAGKSYDFLMKKPDEKTEYGAWKNVGKSLDDFFFSEFPKLPCLITKGQLEGSLSSGFSRGNQRKCWSRERRHWAQPVEKTCNPIFSSHDIWKGLQNRMLQIQFLRYVQDFPLLRSTKWTWLMASILWRSVWKSYTPLTKGSSEEFSAPLTRTSTLWLCQNSYWSHGPVEIVDLPSYKMVILHGDVVVYQRVYLGQLW